MELSKLLVGLLSTLGSAGILAGVGYLFKDVIFKYYEKKITLNIEKELEDFKSEIRVKEKNLEDELKRKDSELIFIRDSLMNLKKEKLTALNSKKLLAYENMYDVLKFYHQTTALIGMLKVLDLSKALDEKYKQDFQKISETIFESFGIQKFFSEMNSNDEKYFQLYLDSNILENFKRFKEISVHAILLINLLKIGLLRKDILDNDHLIKSIVEFIPSAEAGFNKYGNQYAFYWHDYFYNQVIDLLRLEILGGDREANELNIVEDINKTALTLSALDQSTLPCNLILPQEMRPSFDQK